jgi:hypothetical protein
MFFDKLSDNQLFKYLALWIIVVVIIIAGEGKKRRGNRQLGRSKRRWNDNIKIDIREIRCECVDGIQPTEDRVQ